MNAAMVSRLTRHFKERGDTLSADCLKFHLARPVYEEESISEDEYNQYLNTRSDFIRKTGSSDVIIYGAGDEGKLTFEQLSSCGVNIPAFLDTYKVSNGENLYLGRPIITIGEYLGIYGDAPIVITPVHAKNEIKKYLEGNGILNYCLLAGEGKELAKILSKRAVIPEARRLYELSGTKRYFSLPGLKPGNSEVFVDIGAKDGNSTKDFINWCGGNYSKIFVFEPEPEFYKTTVNNLKECVNVSVFQKGCGETDSSIKFSELGLVSRISVDGAIDVPVARLDGMLAGENISFMKFGNGGNELPSIVGSKGIISGNRPRIASIVSNYESIWEIPGFLWTLNPEYKIYLRHYSNYADVTVMYAL